MNFRSQRDVADTYGANYRRMMKEIHQHPAKGPQANGNGGFRALNRRDGPD